MIPGEKTENLPAPAPEILQSARQAHLHYVHHRMPGIRRIRHGKGFHYSHANGRAVSADDLDRIRKLAIPPAWQNVWICADPDGHLQATGFDDRGRRQYRYHAEWSSIRNATKFHRLLDFAKVLPTIRRRVRKDLRLPGLPREKVLAAVVRLLEATHMRVGNLEYARDNESYGLSTLRNRHVKVTGARLRFQFRGKSGKEHRIEFSDERLAKIVRNCQELPGHELFEYVNDEEEIKAVTSGDINDYLKEITGEDFTAKDFRTWAGTVYAMKFLAGQRRTKRILLEVIDQVAARLGNTRAICRRYYIHPAVFTGELPPKINAKSVVRFLRRQAREARTGWPKCR